MYDEASLPIYEDLAKLAKRILKDGYSLVTYANTRYIPNVMWYMFNEGLRYVHTIAVVLEGSFSLQWPNITVAWKPLLWFCKGDKPIVQGRIRDLIKSKRPEDKVSNPLQQSIIEAKHMIEKLTVKSQLVCDPMMGEGATTALASRILERRFIGIEKDSARLRKAKAIIRNFKPSSLYE
jgi:hypothetical protein